MFNTTHHRAFDKWWGFAAENYLVWEEGKAVSADLYYDPVVDEGAVYKGKVTLESGSKKE